MYNLEETDLFDDFGISATDLEKLESFAKGPQKERGFLNEYGISEGEWAELESFEKETLLNLHEGKSPMAKQTREAIIRNFISEFIKKINMDDEKNAWSRKMAIITLASLDKKDYTLSDLEQARFAMDISHEGLDYLKKDLLDEITSAILRKGTPRPLLLVGAPGSGKTSILVSLAKALNKGYEVIPLTGLSCVFELKGNSTSWKDAKCGRILQTCLREQTLSPIIIFDELDKAGTEIKYGNTTMAFLDLLEDSSRMQFIDDYLQTPIDLSYLWPVFTANTLEGIPEPLLDRLRIIEMRGYESENLERIARKMIHKANEEISPKSIIFYDDAIKRLVFETGIINQSARPIREAVYEIFKSKSNEFLNGEEIVEIREKDIQKLFKKETINIIEQDRIAKVPGFVNAIAFTGFAAFLVPIEVTLEKESYGIRTLGMCGSEMQESSVIAYTAAENYVKEHYGKALGGANVNYVTSIKKNGDSAALATAIAIVSEFLNEAVDEKIAITGALTLKGLVLPIGAVNAKIKAAINYDLKAVIVPESNKKEVKAEFKNRIRIIYVSSLEEALMHSFRSIRKNKSLIR